MKKLLIGLGIAGLILGGCDLAGKYEGKTAEEWRNEFYDENTRKVNLYNCVNDAMYTKNTIAIQECLNEALSELNPL